MKKKIIIVEDDQSFRDALSAILAKDYSVLTAENGKVAKSILSIQDVDLVLSDIQMPHFTGVDLLEWVKQNKPCPVILMTGFSHLVEMKRADAIGVDGFLSKPFTDSELKNKLSELLGPSGDEENPPPTEKKGKTEFFKVPIEDFVSQRETTCPVYIQLNNEKYVKIAHKGGKIPQEKMDLFKEKGIAFLYVTKDDFPNLIGFSVQLTKALAGSGIPAEKKNRFLKYTGELLSQQIFSEGFDQTTCQHAKEFVQSSLDIIAEDNEAGNLLIGLNEHTDYLYAHSLGVSAISVLIAKRIGWESPSILFKLAFSGLFHDVGKKELPKAILEKPRFQLTSDEIKVYESHTVRGKEILDSLRNAPSEAVAVAYEHHENALGNGYPRAIDQSKVHPFSKIVNVANVFCNYAIKNSVDHKVLSAQDAIAKMQTNKAFEVDKQAFQALIGVVKK